MHAAPVDNEEANMLGDDDDVDIVDGHFDESECDLAADEEDFSFISSGGANAEDDEFDAIVGQLEEIIMEPEFQEMQERFMQTNCGHFEDKDENKLIYTDIFNQYTQAVEDYIERSLTKNLPGFTMDSFMEMLQSHHDEMSNSDVFELLLSLGDFDIFKEFMLAYNKMLDDAQSGNAALEVRGSRTCLYTDEMADGEIRHDIELCIGGIGTR